jgi:Domain of unknown function (DUF4124)
MRQIKTLAVIAGLLGVALGSTNLANAGDVYKYVDDRGNTLYTDKPMPGAVLVTSGAQRPPEAAQRTYAAQQTATTNQLNASNQRIAENQTNARAAEQVAKDLEATRAERCKKARADYESTINARRLYRDKEGGEREFLDEAQLAQARVDTRKQMDAICGPSG